VPRGIRKEKAHLVLDEMSSRLGSAQNPYPDTSQTKDERRRSDCVRGDDLNFWIVRHRRILSQRCQAEQRLFQKM